MATLTEPMITHQLDLLRLEAGTRLRVFALLDQLRSDIITRLQRVNVASYTKRRLDSLLREVSDTIDQTYTRAEGEVGEVLLGTAQSTARQVKRAVEAYLSIDMSIGLPPESVMSVLVRNSLIMGAPSAEWWSRQSTDTAFRFMNTVRQGIAAGDTNEMIVRRVAGGAGYPGIMDVSRNNARALIHTSIQTVANDARREVYKRNDDIIEGIRQVSTLDSHTSDICIAYDGAEWDLDGNPINGTELPYDGGVPRHWNCRSVEVPITKSFRDLGLDVPEPPEGERASSEGPVPARFTFEDYLETQTKEKQDEILGRGRAALWRSDKITLTQLLDLRGNPLTLDELEEKYGD